MEATKNIEAIEAFIRRWQGREGGQERANYVSFLNELIALLGLPPPDPADATHEHNDYVFERSVKKHRDEGDSRGRIDRLRPDDQVPRFAKHIDKQAAKEEGAQVAAELLPAVAEKPSFPTGAVEQTAAIFTALATASQPLDAKDLAAQFKRSRPTEKKVSEVLASPARLGYVVTTDGTTFALRRAA